MPGHKDNQTQVETILVVDDDSLLRESISLFLDANSYCVLEAENGQAALEVLKTAPRFPCLVMLDLLMPILDGQQFLTQRAQDPLLPWFREMINLMCLSRESRPISRSP